MKSTFFLSLFILLNSFCFAQTAVVGEQKIINNYTFPDEWRGRIILSLSASNGDLWFASTQGVYRYDGKLFYNYTSMGGLNTTTVNCIMEDKNKNIWFGTKGGACKYDGKKFTTVLLPNADGSTFNSIFSFLALQGNNSSKAIVQPTSVMNIMEDASGVFWFGADLNGIYRYDGKALTNFLGDVCKPVADNIQNGIHNIFQDKKGNLWFSKGGCGACHFLFRLNAQNTTHPCINNTCKHDMKNAQQLTIHQQEIDKLFIRTKTTNDHGTVDLMPFLSDTKGNVWFGSYENGVYQFDGKHLVNFSTKDGLNTSNITTILEDKKGNIWFGTGEKNSDGWKGNGVFCYDGNTLKHFTIANGLPENDIISISEAKDGKIWFCSQIAGISCFDGKSINSFNEKNIMHNKYVSSFVKDRNDNFWFSTEAMGLTRFDGKSFVSFTEKEKK
ncbi:MAG: hypothetical protein RL065_2118 [Bacteroidota bacterium]|jgi:ligand-binding sensor domain-containing protein